MPKNENTTAVAKTGSQLAAEYKAFSFGLPQLKSAIEVNLGSDDFTPRDLDRIKVPSGGGIAFTIETVSGKKPAETIEGIIIDILPGRAYWKDSYNGESTPPDCASEDNMVGIGTPGGVCSDCPMNKYGTGKDAKGQPAKSKACKEMKSMLLLRPSSLMPIVVQVPPTSIQGLKKYNVRLASGSEEMDPTAYFNVITEIGLEADKNSTGIEFSKLTFKPLGQVSEEQSKFIEAYRNSLMRAFRKVHGQNFGNSAEDDAPDFDGNAEE